MVLKIINSALILLAIFMGFKQGYEMISGDPKMVEMFSKWNFSKTALMINGGGDNRFSHFNSVSQDICLW